MAQPLRYLAPVVGLAALLAAAPVADEAENYRRLQAMPRERRVALSENLERFDKLDTAEQAAVRKLDADLAARDPVDQARYRAVLRRYHLWINGLTDEQKQALANAATPEARFALARGFKLRDKETAAQGPRIANIRVGEYGLIGPIEVANMLRIWEKLAPTKRSEIEKQRDRGKLLDAIRAQAATSGHSAIPFPTQDLKPYEARVAADPEFKSLLGPLARRIEATRRAEADKKKTEAVPKKPEHPPIRFEHPFAEFLYFEEHPPRPVAGRDLERFSAASPGWLHAMVDPLSPDDARQYLTILYRLLYPHPAEMPADPRPARINDRPPAGPRSSKKSATSAPEPF